MSDGTTETLESITEGTAKTFTYEFNISGNQTFYLYRAAGSGTGALVADVVVEYFAA